MSLLIAKLFICFLCCYSSPEKETSRKDEKIFLFYPLIDAQKIELKKNHQKKVADHPTLISEMANIHNPHSWATLNNDSKYDTD